MNKHIEVMQAIAEVNALIKEFNQAKSKAKQDRMSAKIFERKRHVVWLFHGQPSDFNSIS